MLHRAIATLRDTLRPHLGLGKDRVETLALIVVAMVSARTVDLSHLAAERPGSALVASSYRRLQRFFQYVRLGPDWAVRAARDLLGTKWPRRRAHGDLAKSWFRTGFDQIRHLLRSDPLEAIAPWLRIAPKHIKISRVVSCGQKY